MNLSKVKCRPSERLHERGYKRYIVPVPRPSGPGIEGGQRQIKILRSERRHFLIRRFFREPSLPTQQQTLEIFFGVFSNKLKIANVVPVCKRGPIDQLTNYPQFSLLPSLTNICTLNE